MRASESRGSPPRSSRRRRGGRTGPSRGSGARRGRPRTPPLRRWSHRAPPPKASPAPRAPRRRDRHTLDDSACGIGSAGARRARRRRLLQARRRPWRCWWGKRLMKRLCLLLGGSRTGVRVPPTPHAAAPSLARRLAHAVRHRTPRAGAARSNPTPTRAPARRAPPRRRSRSTWPAAPPPVRQGRRAHRRALRRPHHRTRAGLTTASNDSKGDQAKACTYEGSLLCVPVVCTLCT